MDTPIVSAAPRVYDATTLLGFGPPSPEAPLPEAKPGELLLRYGGWSLQDLRDNAVVRAKDLMWVQDWYEQYPWSAEKLPSGLYALRLPVPDSNRKTFDKQKALLLPGEEPAPVVLAASALLAHHLQTQEDLLKGDWTRCKEQTAGGYHVVLYWSGGRLRVNYRWDDYPYHFVWLASARRLPQHQAQSAGAGQAPEPCPSSP